MINHRLKKLRKEKNISTNVLVDILGISRCNYYKKELGQIKFSLDEAKQLSDCFGMSIEDIFFNQENSKME